MPRLASCCLCAAAVLVLGSSSFAATPPRAVVTAHEPPAGVTVLDRRGDLWLVSGTEAQLAALPNARLLAEPAAPVLPARTFIPAPTPVIDDLVAQVNAAELIAEVQWLVDLGVRSSQSPNLLVVADSLQARLDSYGLATEKHWFPHGLALGAQRDRHQARPRAARLGVRHLRPLRRHQRERPLRHPRRRRQRHRHRGPPDRGAPAVDGGDRLHREVRALRGRGAGLGRQRLTGWPTWRPPGCPSWAP